MEERNEILAMLPESLPASVAEGMIQSVREDEALGGPYELLTYRRESWCNAFDAEIGFPLDDDEEPRPRWSAACRCGNCGQEWHWGWQDRHTILADIENGEMLPGMLEEGEGLDIQEGENVSCPYCWETLVATPASCLRNGRTYQCMMGRAENLGGRITSVIFWMLSRHVDPDGSSTCKAQPWAAVVVAPSGKILCFKHTYSTQFGKKVFAKAWEPVTRMGEPINSRYYSWEACNFTMTGGFYVTDVPDQTGATGEKTGLSEYLAGNGEFVMTYLKAQRRWPQLENIVKSGWVYSIDAVLNEAVHGRLSVEVALKSCFDLTKKKPKEILRMPKASVGSIGRQRWEFEMLKAWRARFAGHFAPEVFRAMTQRNPLYELEQAAERFGAKMIPRILAYCEKQQGLDRVAGEHVLGYYADYRRMLAQIGGGESEIEIFPPHLREAHDRVTRMIKAEKNKHLEGQFKALAEKWAALEWSDGAICARLPRESVELIDEGKTLNHCVGGYAQTHADGKIIVFIRHARRPERSWYTLNIDLTGEKWREIQLHGYGNEYAHGKWLKIPREVREFVDRWEREVLAPTFRQIKREEKRKKEAAA